MGGLPTEVTSLFPGFWASVSLILERIDWELDNNGQCPGPSAQTADLYFSTRGGNPVADPDEEDEGMGDCVVMRAVPGSLAAAAVEMVGSRVVLKGVKLEAPVEGGGSEELHSQMWCGIAQLYLHCQGSEGRGWKMGVPCHCAQGEPQRLWYSSL